MELPAWPAWRLDPAGPDGAHVSWDLRVALNPAAANPAMRAERESLGGRREGARVAPGAHQGIRWRGWCAPTPGRAHLAVSYVLPPRPIHEARPPCGR